ncbi:hypothetical protein [Listeria costaricensis]|uniref:hypothetical protein n=1 Tax=Listeria costaricensis TaxID=2026604 RepID=UPI000C085BF5|nr:hypothetical protein [Listeria costaricensis]
MVVFYSEKHSKIIQTGIEAISKVLNGDDLSEKESLLLCLDKFLDPYFGYELPYEREIILLLQTFITDNHPTEMQQTAIHLLILYAWPPFPILEKNLDKIKPELLASVTDAINMDHPK